MFRHLGFKADDIILKHRNKKLVDVVSIEYIVKQLFAKPHILTTCAHISHPANSSKVKVGKPKRNLESVNLHVFQMIETLFVLNSRMNHVIPRTNTGMANEYIYIPRKDCLE